MKFQVDIEKKLQQIENKIKQKNYTSALDLLENIYDANSNDLHINLLLGEVHLSVKQYRESEKYFNKANLIEKDNYQSLYGLGRIQYSLGEFEKTKKLFLSAHRKNTGNINICNDLGMIYQILGDYRKAEKYFLISYNNSPDNLITTLYIAELLSEKNDYEKALNYIDDYSKSYSSNNELLYAKGIIYVKIKKFDDAILIFNKILKKNTDNFNVLYYRGFCFLNKSNMEMARKDLRYCLELNPNADDIHALLALTYTLEGKISDTIDVWQEFLPILERHERTSKITNKSTEITPVQILDKIEKNELKIKNNEISIIIPVYNENESLIILYNQLIDVLIEMGQVYEIIFIDDGSTDNSLEILEYLAQRNKNISIIKFRRNYGQTASFAAGFEYSTGNVVITMDADLQNDPSDIPKLLKKMTEGYDIVSGWRKDRKDKTLKRKIPSQIANKIINKLIAGSNIQIHDFGCSLKAYKKGIVKHLKLYGEMHRFIPAYAAWLGIKVTEIPVKHHARQYGYPKYGLERVSRVVFDMITLRFFTGFRTRPLQFFGKVATLTCSIGILFSAILLLTGKLFGYGVTGQSFILLFAFSLFMGFQFIVVGLLGEIIMRGFLESQDRKEYVIETIISKKD